MSRPTHLINEFKKTYLECTNPEKDKIVSNALNDIRALTKLPGVSNES